MALSTPRRQGISPSAILGFVEAADTEIDAKHSFMLVRHGHVVAEGWWTPYDAKTPHVLHSLSKSFTSTAVGLAIAERKLSLDDEVLKMFPDEAPAERSANLRAMRVRDLLRMSPGHQTEAALWRGDPASTNDDPWTKTFLAQPVPFKPGTHFLYNSRGTYMLSAMVQKVTGATVLDYLRSRRFDPLGFESLTWVASPQGISAGAWGLLPRTEEIARSDSSISSAECGRDGNSCPRPGSKKRRRGRPRTGLRQRATGTRITAISSGARATIRIAGMVPFGQYCLILPAQDAVVVIPSGVRDMQRVMNLVWDKLLPAMKTEAVPEDAAGRAQLEKTLAGLTVRVPAGAPTSALAKEVSREWYDFPENDRGLQAMALDLSPASPALLVRTAGGETRTAIGLGSWARSRDGFANGVLRPLDRP